jgi:hypothetical protein
MTSPIDRAFHSPRNQESLESLLHTAILTWSVRYQEEIEELTHLLDSFEPSPFSRASLDMRIIAVKNLLVFEQSIAALNRKQIPELPFSYAEYETAKKSAEMLTKQLPEPFSADSIPLATLDARSPRIVPQSSPYFSQHSPKSSPGKNALTSHSPEAADEVGLSLLALPHDPSPFSASFHSAFDTELVPNLTQEESAQFMVPGTEESNLGKPKRRKVEGGKNRWTLAEHNALIKGHNDSEASRVHRKWGWIRDQEPLLHRFKAEQLKDRWRVLAYSQKQCPLYSEHFVP